MEREDSANRSFTPLVIGFLLSIGLTIGMYWMATHAALSSHSMTLAIFGIGSIQALIQFICFFQLGRESKPHWNMIMFLFMMLIAIIVVGGSLWIMYNLNYQMM